MSETKACTECGGRDSWCSHCLGLGTEPLTGAEADRIQANLARILNNNEKRYPIPRVIDGGKSDE